MPREIAQLRREGINQTNILQAQSENPEYRSERRSKNAKPLIRCRFCNITVNIKNLAAHRKRSQLKTIAPVISIPTAVLEVPNSNQYDEGFLINILSKFGNEDVGKLCRTDQTLLEIGFKFYWKLKRKKDKAIEIYRSIRGDMRRLAHCYCYLEKKGVS